MVLLEMLTRKQPYSQCSNPAEIYRLVGEGIRPHEIEDITDSELKGVVLQCLGPSGSRPTIKELLALELWRQSFPHLQIDHSSSEQMSAKCSSLDSSFVSGVS